MPRRDDRRQFLMKTLAGAAAAGSVYSLEERILLAALQEGADRQQAPPRAGEGLPMGQIKHVRISRLFLGGNLIGGWAHARDLIYVSRLFKAYNTDEKVCETLALAEAHGINTLLLDPKCQDVFVKYLKHYGSKMQSMVCISPSEDPEAMRAQIRSVIDKGATLVYTHGEVTDRHVMAGRLDVIAKALELIRAEGVPAGVGSHSLQTPIACEKHGIGPDYYVKTFHPDRYWSASPPEKREEWCWYKPPSNEFGGYHDNIWCLDWQKTAEFMASVKRPWVAFKVMAAGAIHPRIAFSFAYRHGADFIVAGMFDFQLAEDVALAREALRKTEGRTRPWYG